MQNKANFRRKLLKGIGLRIGLGERAGIVILQ